MKLRLHTVLIPLAATALLTGCTAARRPDVAAPAATVAKAPAGGADSPGHVRKLELVGVPRRELPARHAMIWPEGEGWRVDDKWCADASQVLERVRRRARVAVIRRPKADQTPQERMNELAWRLTRQGHCRVFYDPDRGSIDSFFVISEFR